MLINKLDVELVVEHPPANLSQQWWTQVAGLKVVTLKIGRTYAAEVLSLDLEKLELQLDRISDQGFQAIEIFAPAEGRFAYNGLDTTNHYRIDPELGTMEDFRNLVHMAHRKHLAVTIFHNIGYYSQEASDWIEACDLKRAGITTGKVKWFIWADRVDAPPPAENDTYFIVYNTTKGDLSDKPKTWGWQYSERAGCYYWSRWEDTAMTNPVGLPQNDWRSDEWPQEAERIVRFWMDTGIDGMVIDAPHYYVGLNWRKWNRFIADSILRVPNTMIQPEGGSGVGWVTDGRCNCMQNYRFRTFDSEKWVNSCNHALETGDPRVIENSLSYRDTIVAAGAVLYHVVNKDHHNAAKRHLIMATLAAIGEMIVFVAYPDGDPGDPDEEETWILKTRYNHPSLQDSGQRIKLDTNVNEKCYALLRIANNQAERIMVVLNYQPDQQIIKVDISGFDAKCLVDLQTGESIPRESFITVNLPGYGYKFLQVISVGDDPVTTPMTSH